MSYVPDITRDKMLLEKLKEPLRLHLNKVKSLHLDDLKKGYGSVYLPFTLEKKYTNASREWGWQYVFPASKRAFDPRTQKIRRHHLHESCLQKAVKKGNYVRYCYPVSYPTYKNPLKIHEFHLNSCMRREYVWKAPKCRDW